MTKKEKMRVAEFLLELFLYCTSVFCFLVGTLFAYKAYTDGEMELIIFAFLTFVGGYLIWDKAGKNRF